MDLAAIRRYELTQQRGALLDEFADWRSRTEDPPALNIPPPLEKHHSQITRITDQLTAFLEQRPTPAAGAADTIDTYAQAQSVVYFAQRVRAYYREKFALRTVEWLKTDLACADELAWGCYKPAVEKAKKAKTVQEGESKEPPLVFYDPSGSPFAISRGRSFRPEGVTEEEERTLGPAILALPIPVIGVPWFQVNHLPAAVAIAHEVGHAVWWDFGVEGPLREAFKTMHLENETSELPRGAIWHRWLPELFGDVYAVAALGAPFVLGLSAYLSDPIDVVRSEKPVILHPPAYLRIRINCALLEELNLADEGVRAAWAATYQRHEATPYEQDLQVVAKTLLNTPIPKFGAAIRDVVAPPANPGDIVDRIRKNKDLPTNPDFRLLYAGAALLFHRNPDDYLSASQRGALARKFAAKIATGTRALPMTQAELNRQAAADRAAGARIFNLLIGQSTPPGGE